MVVTVIHRILEVLVIAVIHWSLIVWIVTVVPCRGCCICGADRLQKYKYKGSDCYHILNDNACLHGHVCIGTGIFNFCVSDKGPKAGHKQHADCTDYRNAGMTSNLKNNIKNRNDSHNCNHDWPYTILVIKCQVIVKRKTL